MRVALVHDWLTGMRGGEKVLEALCELFPHADLYTLLHVRGSVSPAIEQRRIITSPIQRVPFSSRRYRMLLPLFPWAIGRFTFERYDLVISSSSCVAKGAVAPRGVPHICYCHSPMRYAWDQFDAYFGPERVGPLASRWVYRPILTRLARWDAESASRVTRFVANSAHVAGRIRRYYNRRASVVYPPVDTAFFHPDASPTEDHVLVVSALVPYKRIDLAIEACRQAGVRLRIVGDGPERQRLEQQAQGQAVFLGPRSGDALRDEYRRARAVLLPGEEDFGIVPLEAQACGTPVVALARGGALETVQDRETGVLFDSPTAGSLAQALARLEVLQFDRARLRCHAERFSRARHVEALRVVIDDTLAAHPGTQW
jgi:glycosyltransferase involved in cell wall biosynthesis